VLIVATILLARGLAAVIPLHTLYRSALYLDNCGEKGVEQVLITKLADTSLDGRLSRENHLNRAVLHSVGWWLVGVVPNDMSFHQLTRVGDSHQREFVQSRIKHCGLLGEIVRRGRSDDDFGNHVLTNLDLVPYQVVDGELGKIVAIRVSRWTAAVIMRQANAMTVLRASTNIPGPRLFRQRAVIMVVVPCG